MYGVIPSPSLHTFTARMATLPSLHRPTPRTTDGSNLRQMISVQQHTINTGQRTQQPNSHFAVSEEPPIIVRLLSAGSHHCHGPGTEEQSLVLAGIQTQYRRGRRGTTTGLNRCQNTHTRVGNIIVATIYLQLIQNRYMFRSFTVLQCSHQHCVQPVASDVEVVGYL